MNNYNFRDTAQVYNKNACKLAYLVMNIVNLL